jgi:multimeric flavodoxin WrbA
MNTSSAAFKKYIEDRYVRPAIRDYSMKGKDKAVVVNASLNSKSMERKLDKLNKSMKNNNIIVNIGGDNSRYSWHSR